MLCSMFPISLAAKVTKIDKSQKIANSASSHKFSSTILHHYFLRFVKPKYPATLPLSKPSLLLECTGVFSHCILMKLTSHIL